MRWKVEGEDLMDNEESLSAFWVMPVLNNAVIGYGSAKKAHSHMQKMLWLYWSICIGELIFSQATHPKHTKTPVTSVTFFHWDVKLY